MHRSAAAGAAREGRGRLRRDGHAPRQVGRGPQWKLGQEAAEPADEERQRDRGGVVVAGREGVAERPLAQDDRHVAPDQAADDAARPVGDDIGDRQIRRLDLVDDLPARQEPRADRPAGEGGQADDDDLRAEDPVPPERAVVEGEPGGEAEQREDVVREEGQGPDLDDRKHDSGCSGSGDATPGRHGPMIRPGTNAKSAAL